MKDKGEHVTITLTHVSIVCPYTPGVSLFTIIPEEQCPHLQHFTTKTS